MGQQGSGGMDGAAMGECLAPIPTAAQCHAMPLNAISSNSMLPKAIVDMALVACIPHHGQKPGVNSHGCQCHSIATNIIPLNNMQLHAAKYNGTCHDTSAMPPRAMLPKWYGMKYQVAFP